ncbi:DMT family transporter [Aliikangiella coralliicola]|uniref:DMT family transporter n=1 Tax=Aliikangiella coralliicola TaxID=2592383 RepID=A0A545U629_9GAMM|nr:DMT family transporter [Aliikangiella coralliicola]TQV84916.1 DMT family transporter [Aliikangiella coralliicola]
MNNRNIFDLILLAALWGASFLFMRVSVPEFGAVPMMMVRVALAGLFLLPFVWWKKRQQVMIEKVVPISIVGIFNSAIPFSLIAYSTLYVTAGFASVLNAATPMCAAVIAYLWLNQRLTRSAVIGLFIGLVGVVLLVWDKIGFSGDESTFAILAGLGGAFFYGIAANYSKKRLAGVDALAITTGSQISAAIFLLPMAVAWWPAQMPSIASWINVVVLAIVCTGFAQILYFRLIDQAGAANATTVTFLIPVFGMVWGGLFLDEIVTLDTLLACAVILAGTGLTTGFLKLPLKKKAVNKA